MENNREIKFFKGLGLALIAIGFLMAILITLFMCGHEEQMLAPSYSYKMGIFSGAAIGLSISGGLIRLLYAANT